MARDSRELADALREQPPVLDDVARARLEKAILQAPRAVSPSPRMRSRRPFVAGVGAGFAVAAAVSIAWLAFGAGSTSTAPAEVATLETFSAGAVRDDALVDGEVVTTGDEERVRARFAERRVEVEVAPSSRARFLRLSGADLAVGLDRGSVRVSFHPERRGDRTLAIETPLARVEVVGTVFEVDVDAAGTRVRVEEGVVRVVPRDGVERFVRAGESVRVRQARAADLAADGASAALAASTPSDAVERLDESTLPSSVESTVVEDTERTVVEETFGGAVGARSEPRRTIGTIVEPVDLGEPSADAEGTADVSEALADPGANDTGEPTSPPGTNVTSQEVAEVASSLASPRGRSARPLPEDARFEIALRHLDAERFDAARHELHAIARTSGVRSHRARAWADIALTYARQGDARQATEAYRRAAQIGRGTEAGANALFALGQMRLRLGEDELARAAFREYVQAAPDGPLADRARRTLCQRLGVWQECGE